MNSLNLTVKFLDALNRSDIKFEKLHKAIIHRQFFQCFLFSLTFSHYQTKNEIKDSFCVKFFSDDTYYIVTEEYEIDKVIAVIKDRLNKCEELFDNLEDKIDDIFNFAFDYNIDFQCELFKYTLLDSINANVADSIMQFKISGMNFDYTYENSNYIYLIVEEIANCKNAKYFFANLHHYLRLITPKNFENHMIDLCADVQKIIKSTDLKQKIDKDIVINKSTSKKNKI